MDPRRIRLVLLRTHHGRNLGAVARVAHNFGLERLVLAELGAVRWPDARSTAVRSEHLLEAAERATDLREAVAGCAWVVGTTSRRLPGQRDLDPAAVATELAARSRAGEEVALVFGEERVGLSNRDLVLCHDTSIIPTTAQLPSLNLAQAVLVYAWELARHRPGPDSAPSPRATEADYARLEEALRQLVERVRFAEPDRPRHGVQDILHTLKRAGLTPREARLWEALLRRSARRVEPD